MKFLLITSLLFLTACGSLRQNCHLDGQTCDTFFGKNTFEQDERLNVLEKNVAQLQTDLKNLYNFATNLSVNYSVMQNQLDQNALYLQQLNSYNSSQDLALLQAINNTTNNIMSLQTQLTNQNTLISNQQTQINSALLQLATLNGYKNIVNFYDPCGDKSGKVDEIFFVLSTGEMVSSFSDNSNGQNTRFALLTPGSFMTTDSTNCYFNVVADPQPGKPNQVKLTNEHY